MLLSNEREYRLAEADVIAWLGTLPLDLRAIDAKIAAALRAEQLVRLNSLRQLAARGKLPTALAWIEDFLASGEPLVVFAEHVAIQRAVIERFPGVRPHPGRGLHPSPPAGGGRVRARRWSAADRLLDEGGRCRASRSRARRTSPFSSSTGRPARHEQAEDRLHRIGQDDAVTAWYLLAPDTIDETMAELLQRKRNLIHAVTDGRVGDGDGLVEAVVRELRGRPFRHLRVVA